VAEIFPNEGLDLIYAVAPQGGTGPANTWLGLFTAYTASTVGSSAAVIASWTEVSGGAYTRMTISSASWGTVGTTQSGHGYRSRPGDVPDRNRRVGNRERIHLHQLAYRQRRQGVLRRQHGRHHGLHREH